MLLCELKLMLLDNTTHSYEIEILFFTILHA